MAERPLLSSLVAGSAAVLLAWWWQPWAGVTLLVGAVVLAGLRLRQQAASLRRAQATNAQQAAGLAQLQANFARLESGLSGVSEGLLVLDAGLRVTAANPAAEAFAALPLGRSRGRSLSELIRWPQLQVAVDQCRTTGEPQHFEIHDQASGRTLLVRVQGMDQLGFAIGFDDLSRLRRLESHRRDFVANVSHELKTPLAAIQGFVETLLDDPDVPPPTRQRFLQRIARQTERLTTLVADLLTLSRLDEERSMQVPAADTDLHHVIKDALRDLQPLRERRRLQVTFTPAAGPQWIRAERETLRQVVGNLIDNAFKYTPEGGSVSVRVRAEDGFVLLEVEDTGIGLSPEDQERVFERFYRVDKARSRELGGTGLGLSIVKNTVVNLGGEVGVRSALGKGSTFWVRLPLAKNGGAKHAD